MSARLVTTPTGRARLTTAEPSGTPVGTLVLGHGAGGLRWSADVTAAGEAAVAGGWRVVLLDQPWRVEGRRVGPGPRILDRAWLAALAAVPRGGPLVVGGRSAGARVACRTAGEVGAAAVLALSFPLHPPGRPERSRAQEVAAPGRHGVPVHVVQGRLDPFGTAEEVRAVLPRDATLVEVEGGHALERSAADVAAAVEGILRNVAVRSGVRHRDSSA